MIVKSTRLYHYFDWKIQVNVTEAKVGMDLVDFTSICSVYSRIPILGGKK